MFFQALLLAVGLTSRLESVKHITARISPTAPVRTYVCITAMQNNQGTDSRLTSRLLLMHPDPVGAPEGPSASGRWRSWQ